MKLKYLLLKIFFLFFTIPFFGQNDPIPDVEYQALVEFYNTMSGESWINKWDISTNNLHTTNWYGIVIEAGHIVEINLGSNGIAGAIPASFSNLINLRKLDLYYNNFNLNDLSTTDLNNLSGLENLEELDLSNCQLSGSIPSSWGQLTKLTTLVLNNNTIDGAIFSEIGNLTLLETIDFSYNNFTSIPATIENLTNLKTLNLVSNEIITLPMELENLTSLTHVYLSRNQISDVVPLLSTDIYLSLDSQTLTLGEFIYTGEDVLLTNLPPIIRYDRYKNDFSEINNFSVRIDGSNVGTITANADGSLLIPKDYVSSLAPEKQVSLYQQSGTAYYTTINFTTTTVNLPEVPEIEYQALVDFYNAMDGESWINQWDVSTNNLNQGAWYGLGIEDGHIVEINLGSNGITGAIPASFSNLIYLRKLDLYSNNYNLNDLSTTDLNNLSGLENLEELDLSNCQLSGSIPSSWGQLTKLTTLVLNNNTIDGAIFSEIGNLTLLETIDFSYNNFTSIPATIENLTNLKTLNLVSNEIITLPMELENLTSLTHVYLSRNQISDVVPLLSTDIYLSLDSQTLTLGEFIYTGEDVLLTNLPPIIRYDRYKNDFSEINNFSVRIDGSNVGTITANADGSLLIPKDYVSSLAPEKQVSLYQQSGTAYYTTINFTTTTVNLPEVPEIEYQALVDFYNAMDGESWINQWDVSTNNLNQGAWYGLAIEDGHIVEINLGSNGIAGAIPASFSNLINLRKLDLYYNNFNLNDLSTTDLNNLSGLENLEELDLSNCQLSGSIPSSWGQLSNLKSLALNNNTIDGAIFSEIGNLTLLETIDFSYNNFTSIPATIENLTNLKTLNLNYNEIITLPIELENLTSLTHVYLSRNQISDVVPLLSTDIYLSLDSQTLTLGEFIYTGEDVLLTNLPPIIRYDRYKNDFSEINNFSVRIDGSNVGTITANADGSLIIPKDYVSSLAPEKQVSLYQQSGTAYYTTINFTTTTVNLPEVPEIEYQALVDFYNAMDGESWINQWDVSTNNLNQGAWYGLAIEDGHIVEINLGSNGIAGAIPASFSNLINLRKLDLYYNNFNLNDLSTTDLNNLSGLENLEELDLSNCQLSGSIPSSWGQLSNLKSLDLSNNFISGSNTNFSGLVLTNLNLSYQDIFIESIEIGANEINIDLPMHLNFELIDGQVSVDAHNEFQLFVNGTYQKTAFSNNGRLVYSNINVLNLEVTDKLRIYQVNGVSAYSNINYDSLTFGQPLLEEEFEILQIIYNSTNGASWTTTWDTSENNLNIESWYGVSIKEGHVVSINLSHNNLSGSLPEEITGLSYLKTLTLNNNSIEGNLPVNINLLTDLETLDLSSNSLSGIIPESISELQVLKKFAIGNNLFIGTIPSQLSDFIAIEYLDLSNNGFNIIEKKLYYDFSRTYIDLRNQIVDYNTILSLDGDQLKVELDNICEYDLENNNFDAQNSFALLVNDVIHTSTITNELGEIIFDNVRIGEIPSDANISIRQTSGTFNNTEFNYLGIEDKSNIPVLEEEYLALVELFNSLDGNQWTNTWDVNSNNLHTNQWYGVSNYDGHIVSIDLNSNNVTNTIPNIFDNLPYLNTLNLSSNKLSEIEAALPPSIDFIYDRQAIEGGDIELNKDAIINDFTINRYEHAEQNFNNQTYNIEIDNFFTTVSLPEEGIKLIDLMSVWNVPNNQILELHQVSGDARNSIINYYLQFQSGDSNLDSNLNILDIQTSINYILGNYINYFNYSAADVDGNTSINVLDIIGQVNIIQNQEIQSRTTNNGNLLSSRMNNEDSAKIGIENGVLILDTNGNEVASFQILVKDTSIETFEELISQMDFTVSAVNKDNYLSIIAYSFNSTLNGKVSLANISNNNPSIQSVILSDVNAVEINSEIMETTLDIYDLEVEESLNVYNFPNPFKEETTISFYVNNRTNKALFSIYDLNGRIIEKIQLDGLISGKNHYLFKRKKMSSGVYLYKLSFEDYGRVLKGKLIIK